jgi:TolB protein
MDAYFKKMSRCLFWIMIAIGIYGCQGIGRNGKHIIYLSKEAETYHLQIMDANGNNIKNIDTGLISDGCPLWSPNGDQILFISDNGTVGEYYKYNIFVYNMKKDALSQITYGDNAFHGASWSPDGTQIVFSSDPSYQLENDLNIINVDGTNLRQITNSASRDIDPAWSPDGKKIIYSSITTKPDTINNKFEIYLLNLADGKRTRITNESEYDYTKYPPPPQEVNPVWSPDGKRIAYCTLVKTETKTYSNIWIMNEDGSNKWQVTNTIEFMNGPVSWAPDGNRIVISSNNDIYIMDLNSLLLSRLTTTGNNYCPSWEP